MLPHDQRRRFQTDGMQSVSPQRLVILLYERALRDLAEAPALIDRVAPEHLELAVAEPEALLAAVRNAGAIFLGRYTPEALGDYLAGPNHVLPTDRAARFSSGLSVYDFGCAEGVMVSVLDDLGAHATGSDLDRPKVSYGRSILGLSQLSDDGDYFWSLPDRSLDCLYASHFVEHVLRADELFDRFSRAVKPGGHLVVAVPCTAVREAGRVGEMGGDHLIGYDRAILAGFFRRHGFEVVDCQVDDGTLPADRLDPLLHLPDWSGQPFDVTIVGRRHAA